MDTPEEQLQLDLGQTSEPAIPHEVVDALNDLLEPFGGEAPSTAFEADSLAAAVGAAFRMATGDLSLTGESDRLLARPSPEEAAALQELRAPITAAIGSMVRDGEDSMVGALQCLAVYGGPFQPMAVSQLEALGLPSHGGGVHAWASPQTATIKTAYSVTNIPGDDEELVLELAYPEGGATTAHDTTTHDTPTQDTTAQDTEQKRVGIAILLDTFGGLQPVGGLACEDLDEFFEGLLAEEDHFQITEVPVDQAMATVAHAFWVFDHTLGAADYLPDDSDLLLLRPLIDRLLATGQNQDYEPPEVDQTTRDAAVVAFTAWVEREHPEMMKSASNFAPLLIDFAADEGRDPMRWSPVVSVNCLHMVCHRLVAPPAEMASIPALVRLIIRWAHGEKGWPAALTEETLAEVDRVQPLFDAELTGPGVDQSRKSGPAGLVEVAPVSVDPGSVGADCYVLRVHLANIRPEIWRRVRLPVGATFAQLHDVLQLTFGWYDCHLHSFDLGAFTAGPTGGQFGLEQYETHDEAELQLCDVIGPGSEFTYLYDFGDSWEHRIVVEETEDVGHRTDTLTGQPMGPFALLGGAMAGPPEDCGGSLGYTDLMRALKKENHPRRAELADRLPAGFNPKYLDVYTLNQAVQKRYR